MEITFRPITLWPRPALRTASNFKTSHSKTMALLERELRYLGAKDVALQIAVHEGDIRRDGLPYADCRPSHPGVIVSFASKHGPLSYPCDTYTSWTDNLRAIALALECLRAVDRYGVTRTGEQYRGWTALPAPARQMTKEDAVKFLETFIDGLITSPEEAKEAARAGAMATHPDRGGDTEKFNRLQQAKEVLGL
jgi:hypothetical protein